jgi:molybdenum cofactor guanylyltransferase
VSQAQEVLACVLAGGRSRRLGTPKAIATLGGRPLVEYPLVALRAAGYEPVVVAKRASPLPPLEHEVWLERDRPAHPLVGILTAVERAQGRSVLVCACDLPFVTPQLLEAIAGAAGQVVVPRAGGRLHPLLARYGPASRRALASALADERSIHETIAALEHTTIEEHELRRFGEPERLLFNVNTFADLERAELMLAAR